MKFTRYRLFETADEEGLERPSKAAVGQNALSPAVCTLNASYCPDTMVRTAPDD
jgi:hypothetical protein